MIFFFNDSNLLNGTLFHSNRGDYKLLFMNIVLSSIDPRGLHGGVAGRIVSVVDDVKWHSFNWAAWQQGKKVSI